MPPQFANAWMLSALWLAPLLGLGWLLLYQRRARGLERFLSPAMQSKLCPPPQPRRFYWQWSALLAGCLLALLAAARPQWGLREERVIQRGRDLVIALDVSRSMLAQDAHPSRLQRAKTDIQDLLRELRGDRAALITFRGRAVQLCPLTTDYAYLEQILNDADIESAPRGETDIGAAIRKALEAFENDPGSHQAMVLISDGEDLSGQARQAAAEAQKKGVVIFTVGLGDPQGAKIPGPLGTNAVMMYQGKEVVTKLEHATLKTIAETTGGAYVPVGVANVKLGDLYRDHLSKIAARDIEESIQRRYLDRYQWFLCPGVALLLLTALLSRGRLARSPAPPKPAAAKASAIRGRVPGKALAALLLLLTAASATPAAAAAATQAAGSAPSAPAAAAASQSSNAPAAPAMRDAKILPGREGARQAQNLYLLGKYKEAAAAYLMAARDCARQLRNTLTFNAACALYRDGQYQAAADKFAEAAREEEHGRSAAGHYNAGCAWFRLAEQAVSGAESNRDFDARPLRLDRAGREFQRTLRLDPEQAPARANLAAVAQILPGAREQAKVQALLEKYGNMPPFQIADQMLVSQRKLLDDLGPAMTNASPARISMLEALAGQQRQNADLLIPLRASLAAAMAAPALPGGAGSSNAPANPQQQMDEAQQHLDALRNVMLESREFLRNLENKAYGSAATVESGIYTFWKAVAPFLPLLHEDLRRQTNAIVGAQNVLGQASPAATAAGRAAPDSAVRDILAEQEEAGQLTQLFTNRFTQAVPPEGLKPPPAAGTNAAPPGAAGPSPAAGGTNAPQEEGITPETRATILNLAREAKARQEQASRLLAGSKLPESLVEQRKSYELLLEILKLLPKDKDDQQQQDKQEQKQDQKQEQKQDQQKQDQQPQPDEKNQDQPAPEQAQPPPEQQPPREQPPQTADQDQPKPKDKEMTPDQARALLDKARQREKEHQEEREQNQYIPPSPVEKDW